MSNREEATVVPTRRPRGRIRNRIFMSNLVAVLLVAVAGVLVLLQVRRLLRSVETLERANERVEVVSDVRFHTMHVFAAVSQYLPLRDPELFIDEVGRAVQELEASQQDLIALAEGSPNPAAMQGLEGVNGRVTNILNISRTMLRQVANGQWSSVQVRVGVLRRDQQQINADVNRLLDQVEVTAANASTEVAAARRAVILYPALILLAVGVFTTFTGWRFARGITRPVENLTDSALRLAGGALDERVDVSSDDEIGQLARVFNDMANKLQASHEILEERVAERTQDLELAAEVGQRLSQVRDLDSLLEVAVNRIRERFDLYYTQVYLTDPRERRLILVAGTGRAGADLMERGHYLPVDGKSINGTAVMERRAVIISETQDSVLFRPNPALPETRSEMAVPLIAGERIVGVLDLQSAEPGVLTEESLAAFNVLAGQLAIAVENARLFDEVHAARAELETRARYRVSESWDDFLNAIDRAERLAFTYSEPGTREEEGAREAAGEANTLSATIELASQPVGSIQLEAERSVAWRQDHIEVVNQVAEQVAQRVENLRLLAEADRYRSEAEEALQRFVREGWESYHASHVDDTRAYLYDGGRVQPVDDGQDEPPAGVRRPLQVRGEAIGELVIAGDDGDDDASELIGVVAENLSAHLETLRLSHQRESALADAQQRSEELARLNRLVTEISSTLDLRDSLNIVVRELVDATIADQARIALMDDEGRQLTIVAEAYDESRSASAMGVKIPIEGNELTQQVLDTAELVVVTDAQSNPRTAPVHEILRDQGVETMILMPILAGNQVLGTVGVDVLEKDKTFAPEERRMAENIIFQASTAIQNTRLFDQVQEALAETETLYNVSTQLNAATSPQEIVDAIARPMLASAEGTADLFLIETDADEDPEWAELIAATSLEQPEMQVGTRVYLPEFPLSSVWQEYGEVNFFIGDAETDDRVEGRLRTFMKETNAQSLVVLPLKRGGRWLGMVIGRWPTPYDFDEHEKRLYESMAAQATVVLDRWLLTAEIRKRAEQLEQLANIETALSQATTEEEILTAVTPPFAGQETLHSMMLSYLDTGHEGRPTSARPVAVWKDGGIDSDNILLDTPFEIDELALEHEPLEENVILIADMLHDPRVGETGRALARRADFRGMAIVLLHTGGRAHGNLLIQWREPYDFTDDDRFFLQQLVEPLAAVVARHQASEAQQQALEETSVLYKAGAELNRARTYDDIVDVLRRYTVAGDDVTTVALVLFDRVWTQDAPPKWLEIAAYWSAIPVDDEQERYPLDLFPAAAATLQPDAPTFIPDVANDSQIDENTRKLYGEVLKAESALFVPLWVGGQWLGYVTSAYASRREVTDREMQRLTTLVGQAAVTVQSIGLLDETNRLLASEQRQRRVADAMLRATNRMSGVLDESQIRQVLVEETADLLRADVTMYEWQAAEPAFRAYLRRGPSGATKVVDESLPPAERPELWELFEQSELQLHSLAGNGDDEMQRYAIPWLVGNDVAGMLEIAPGARRSSLSQEDRASVVGIVQQAAVRLQGARLFEETEMQAEELAVLNEMGRELTARTEVEAVMETVYDYLDRLMEAGDFYIALHDVDTGDITFPLAVENGEPVSWPSRKPGNGLTEHVIERREALLIQEDMEERLQELGVEAIEAGAGSWLGSPLVFGDRVTGVIAVHSPAISDTYDERDLELLNAVASAAAIAIQNARLFQETQERAAETRALYEASRSINTAQSHEDVLTSLRKHTILGQGLRHITLNYFDRPWTAREKPGWIETVADWGRLSSEIVQRRYQLSDFPPARKLLQSDKPTIITDMSQNAGVDEATRELYAETYGATGTIFVPLVVGGQWVGFINAMYGEAIDFAEQDVRRLMAITRQAAVAVQSLHLLRDAQRRARREQILRRVTSEVRSVTDVDLIMKTAVREVGRALGREAFVYLGNGEQTDTASGKAHESSKKIEQETA